MAAVTFGSFSVLSSGVLPKRYEQSTGVKVNATMVDAANDTMNAIPNGINILPSIPERKNSGRKLAITISEELKIG
jgi:hypothetical protein